MKKFLFPYLTQFFAFFLMATLLFPTIGMSTPQNLITATAPNTAGVGQPFLVSLSLPRGVQDLKVLWNERTVCPEVTTTDDVATATVLLGTSLRREPGPMPLKIQGSLNGRPISLEKTVTIVPHEYQSETLSVAPKMITPPQSEQERIAQERTLALGAIHTVSARRMWRAPFLLPVKGKKLSRFGLYRVFNKETKRRHKGLDFRAWLGTPIHSIAPGRVVLVGNFYYAGNCVYIDHGNGVVSSSIHLSKVLVKQGDTVEAGQKIGLSGATGRATGAHLHLSVFVQGTNIDPEPLFTMKEQ